MIGSKNRKISIKDREEIQFFRTGAAMYGFATEIADTFCNYLDKMGEERVEELRQFLTETRLTINFEFESPHHQHIVPLYDSKLVLIGCSGQSL